MATEAGRRRGAFPPYRLEALSASRAGSRTAVTAGMTFKRRRGAAARPAVIWQGMG